MVNVERKMQLRAGIDARKAERTRKKDLHEFQKSNPDTEPPIGLRTEIIDPDVTQKKRKEKEEEDRLLAIEESGIRWLGAASRVPAAKLANRELFEMMLETVLSIENIR
ncbi:hypothetical protein VC83_09263 [Pseudogymnoascus destructans]|uniref:Uncharacterized protein n=1 Tax=Pseudogymnoascus destructans TaxID=655981 RepID=A0A176ZXA3_9PEZI|nr:uncharacterized protein VC83_09263 [Pseudogymnoascus destructans]OAF54508.1 hypothetical protein VC83_09263 [Pseudogymnoascus destructans]